MNALVYLRRVRSTVPLLGLLAALVFAGGVLLGNNPEETRSEFVKVPIGPEPGPTRPAAGHAGVILERLIGNGEEVFKRQCVVCHGDKGKGNGPAAAALRPRPADLTDPGKMGDYTEKKLAAVISSGKGMMPAFGAVLSSEDLQAVATFVYSLSHGEKEGGS